MKESRAYGNIEIYSPEDELMFRCNEHKLAFYLKKDLVEKIDDVKYRLNFEPAGTGHSERNTELLVARDNRCVRCGDEDLFVLTRHHVVPSRFRKYLPLNIKSNNHRYVVFLCIECHEEYTSYENMLNDDLAAELGVRSLKECTDEIILEKRIITGIADTILFKDRVPNERIEELKKMFLEKTGMEPTHENLLKTRRRKYEPITDETNFGKLIVDKVKNVYEFQQMWLEHFVEKMHPKFLPHDLLILITK